MSRARPTLLYVSSLSRGAVSSRRADLFEDAGWRVERLDTTGAYARHGRLAQRAASALGAGPIVEQINADLDAAAERLAPGSVAFFDKPVAVRPQSLRRLAGRGVTLVSYMPDDPFGPRRDGVWRLFLACLPLFDLHIVPRKVSVSEFERAGARRVAHVPFSFDPRFQVPNPDPRGDYPRGYSYIGAPYEQRPRFLHALHQRLAAKGIPLSVTGTAWSHWRHRKYGAYFNAGPNLWDADYRDAIWQSRACLAFVTRLNRDELSHKAIEIAACGCPPVLEPSPHHLELFEDGVSAIFFDSLDECAEKLIGYWGRPDDLRRMGAEAARRVRANDHAETRIVRLVERFLCEHVDA